MSKFSDWLIDQIATEVPPKSHLAKAAEKPNASKVNGTL